MSTVLLEKPDTGSKATEALTRVNALGVMLSLRDGDRLKATPAELVTEEVKRLVRENRAQIIAALRAAQGIPYASPPSVDTLCISPVPPAVTTQGQTYVQGGVLPSGLPVPPPAPATCSVRDIPQRNANPYALHIGDGPLGGAVLVIANDDDPLGPLSDKGRVVLFARELRRVMEMKGLARAQHVWQRRHLFERWAGGYDWLARERIGSLVGRGGVFASDREVEDLLRHLTRFGVLVRAEATGGEVHYRIATPTERGAAAAQAETGGAG